jgi:hypothetical protein
MARQTRRARAGTETSFRAKVRMYRHGLGDCLLVTLPRNNGTNYHILIDCGVIIGTRNPQQVMRSVLSDVANATDNHVHLLVGTHEHWDHLSGFVQAADVFKKLIVDEVWLAWTEDPNDALGQKLAGERRAAVAALRLSANAMLLAGDDEGAHTVGSLVEFFGAARGFSTHDALEAVRAKVEPPRYCKPEDPPVEIAGTGARIFVLGPPQDERRLKKALPSKSAPETYGLVQLAFDTQVKRLLFGPLGAIQTDVRHQIPYAVQRDLIKNAEVSPFDSLHSIPNSVAQEMDFFKQHYWGFENWRRVDGSWLGSSTELALQLDSTTNNTSLVLAIELPGGDVLLFAADAQVGNWESWQDLHWTVDSKPVTGPDLLRRTIFYKVGHHGSHNATLKERGLELMENLQIAAIPVDHEMAVKKKWGQMPRPSLVAALKTKTSGAVLRSDADAPQELAAAVKSTALFFEITL